MAQKNRFWPGHQMRGDAVGTGAKKFEVFSKKVLFCR
jgi:hypothetical protein